ncbi:MAG: hypothetical protein ACHQFX_20035, partial [Chitinophagales bacterium]
MLFLSKELKYFYYQLKYFMASSLRRTLDRSVHLSSGLTLLLPLLASPPLADRNDGEGAVLHLFNDLHNYHIGLIPLSLLQNRRDSAALLSQTSYLPLLIYIPVHHFRRDLLSLGSQKSKGCALFLSPELVEG